MRTAEKVELGPNKVDNLSCPTWSEQKISSRAQLFAELRRETRCSLDLVAEWSERQLHSSEQNKGTYLYVLSSN